MAGKKEEKKFSLEEGFKELDNIVSKMDDDEISLEEQFKLYESGIKLVKECNTSIDKVEKQMEVLANE
ncbi:MAG: exodeoxyribonuclease VII small subunit [Lachnospiraceae bacterium]|jgi:exodeoxyribonuclease VII small subunit|nr:exodeoxyribonuclease VII small subunit [Lachnospiraceae bacterium]